MRIQQSSSLKCFAGYALVAVMGIDVDGHIFGYRVSAGSKSELLRGV
jgi:hypothetical protein